MRPLIDVAIAILKRGSLILICQRSTGSTFAGLWEFPGGKCEAGESPLQTLRRELQEELAIDLSLSPPPTALSVIEHDYDDFSVRLHPFVCTSFTGEPRPLSARHLEWIQAARIADYPFPPANAVLVQSVAKLR